MSMVDQGMSRPICVCRWHSGRRSRLNPPIHILPGLNVCIHATTPMQLGAPSASRRAAETSFGVVTTALKTTFTGSAPDPLRPATTASELARTRSSASGP